MRRQERAVRTQRSLVASAAAVFDRSGYAGATLADISAGAGVSLGALHFHFDNKAAVAAAVQAAAVATLMRGAGAVRDASSGPVQALTDVTHMITALLSTDVVVRAALRLDREDMLPGGRPLTESQRSCIAGLLSAARDGGELVTGVDIETITCTVMAVTTGTAMLTDGAEAGHAHTALAGFWRALHRGIARPDLHLALDPGGSAQVVRHALVTARGRAATEAGDLSAAGR